MVKVLNLAMGRLLTPLYMTLHRPGFKGNIKFGDAIRRWHRGWSGLGPGRLGCPGADDTTAEALSVIAPAAGTAKAEQTGAATY